MRNIRLEIRQNCLGDWKIFHQNSSKPDSRDCGEGRTEICFTIDLFSIYCISQSDLQGYIQNTMVVKEKGEIRKRGKLYQNEVNESIRLYAF